MKKSSLSNILFQLNLISDILPKIELIVVFKIIIFFLSSSLIPGEIVLGFRVGFWFIKYLFSFVFNLRGNIYKRKREPTR